MSEVKWIKITPDIFDDEKMLIIESLPAADSIIVIWFKLLCLAGKQNNDGVFLMNNRIAYTDEMLASIFRRDVNTVKMALDVFNNFEMIDIIDNVVTIPNWNKYQTLDSYEKKKERDRKYQQERRAKQKGIIDKSSDNRLTVDDNSLSVAITDKEIEIDNNTCLQDRQFWEDFELIYQLYPKKTTKASAFQSYKKWVQKSGRRVGGKTYHLTNNQIWHAVDRYVTEQQEKGTDLTYYKNFSTLMNQILDYVEEEQ